MMIDPRVREQFEASVVTRLRGLGRRVRWHVAVDGVALLAAVLLALIVVTFLIDRALWLGRDMRAVQLASVLGICGAAAWFWLIRPLRVAVSPQELALLVERRFPQLESRLITAVEFAAPDAAQRHTDTIRSPELIDAVMLQARRAFEPLPITETLDARRFRQRGAITGGLVLLLAAGALLGGQTMSLWFQRNVLLRDVEWPLRHRLLLEGLTDGKLIVPRGDDVSVTALVAPGFDAPRQVFIEYQGAEGLRGRDQMPAVEGRSSFTYTFERVNESLTCRVFGGDAPPQSFRIEVIDRPQITQVVIGVTPPKYTHLDPYELRAGQTVAEALRGSRIRLRIATNKPVVQATLVRVSTGQEKEVGVAEGVSGAELTYEAADLPDASSGYFFRMVDRDGLSNISERTPPVRVSVRLVADKPPKVRMKLKGVGEMITPQAILPVEMDFADTYGLSNAYLAFEHGTTETQPAATHEPLPGFAEGTRTFAHALDWLAAAHALKEGDRITLRAEATDFDDVSGPNVGQSPSYTLRVVNREELLAELNRREQEYRQDFERLQRQQEELYSAVLTLSDPAAERQADRNRRFGQLARTQRDFAGRVGAMRLQFEQVLSELRVNQLSSPAAEARLGGGIVEPMNTVSRTYMPNGADLLEGLSRQVTPEALAAARAAQETIRLEMQRILTNMLKWEGFQEAVSLLREILKMQGNLNEETEKRIESEVFGNSPASKPSDR